MVLTSKARQLLPLGARRPVNALADVSVGLLHPSGNRLRGRLELTRQLLGRASGSHQIDHLSPELRRISGSIAAHQTPQQSTSRVSTKPGQLQRAVRLVFEREKDHPSRWATVTSIAAKIGCTAQSLNEWVKKAEIDSGVRGGVPTEIAERLKALERENRELRQANEILDRM